MREPVRATTLLFPTRKIVCLGATSEAQSIAAVNAFVALLSQACESTATSTTKMRMKQIGVFDFQIRNVVGSTTLNFKSDFRQLCRALPGNVRYEPELFPGLYFTLDSGNVVCILFTTRKLILTGAKSQSEIEKIYKDLFPVLEFYNNVNCFKIYW